ncbi:hypothetical protein SI65_01402 [Aspergillus cristatus]|uniref:Thioesterase domain-containing protein n=1 Tax=Aspergillus cristatus TaxID=573508 RepID=A0A1E3BS61_ASPCR|nr:hypothetical protein SI65_01402 [Aspergillus cristatus]
MRPKSGASSPQDHTILGGWSIGGMYSYEITRHLTAEGQEVVTIPLIHSPCPQGMPNMPDLTIEAFEVNGLYALIKRKTDRLISACPWISRSMQSTLLGLSGNISPPPLELSQRPRLVAHIWASKGVYEFLSLRLVGEVEQLAGRGPAVGAISGLADVAPEAFWALWMGSSRWGC